MTEQMNVPKLRFGEFSENWQAIELGELMAFKNGINASKEQYGRGVKFINVLDIIENDYITYDRIVGSVDVEDKEFQKNIVEHGDILFQRSSETREDVGQANVYLDEKKVATFGGFVIRGKKIGEFDSVCMNYLLKTDKARKEVTTRSGGSTRYNVGQATLSAVNIHLPPSISEQQKIASFLSKVDEKIALLTEKKDKLTEYKKGVMQQLFNGKWQEQDGKIVFVPPTLRFKADDGSDFPDWDEKKLGDFYKNLSTGMTPSRKVSEYFKGDNLWITSGELNFGFVNDTKEKITAEAIKDTSLKIYPAGTFFIAITGLEAPGTRGRCAINAVPATTNQSCMAFERLELVDTNFLYFWYKNYSEAFYCKYAQGTKQQSFNNKLVEGIPINLPVKAEQTKIADFLSGIEQKIGLVNSELEKAKEWKKGLLQQMFV
ncbi:restriction endonuclease subunit S [Photobacterium damselae subsp. piscicida]|uniref:restriction endonuclease subunit S n=1 Tax=Photobacterium damselae TaxID=38293 RepID=UPI00031F781A|nr:restriction endonuclease subunit S [Photobacterium damselae]OLQ80029.1 restriction endonuclease subunit S [Photobacterium damselae subsp. piscicida]TJZ89828.1 restriction endonuclease subunit S [Photobacterium damselae subsp. piscicida]BBC41099.1 type-1 restriction enzyme EcoKI specificity protein [Photobacterium damselae subsp. piscicida]